MVEKDRTKVLWLLTVIGAVLSSLLYGLDSLTGNISVDGIIGVECLDLRAKRFSYRTGGIYG